MNQTIRHYIATILVVLNFTHPANADAQQKFSFQGVSYNGDIKPEQFRFLRCNRLKSKAIQKE